MSRRVLATFSALALATTLGAAASPALARGEPDATERPKEEKPKEPVTSKEVSAVDVAATPMTDLNLRKDEIPQILIDAQTSPYTLNGLGRCAQIAAKVDEFNAVLGDDIDLPQVTGKRISAGRIGQWVVGSFIPFRGVIREISGANDQQNRLQAAIQAGVARRSFLKGVGEAKGCRYPARSATREVWDQRAAELRKASAEDDKPADDKPADAKPAPAKRR